VASLETFWTHPHMLHISVFLCLGYSPFEFQTLLKNEISEWGEAHCSVSPHANFVYAENLC